MYTTSSVFELIMDEEKTFGEFTNKGSYRRR